MSWRIALVLFVAVPAVVALGGSSAYQAGLYVGKAVGFGLLLFPLSLLSIWQIAHRFSESAFATAKVEHQSANAKQLVSIARTLDGTNPRSEDSSGRLIDREACIAGLRVKRFLPTIVEGIVFAIVMAVAASVALSLLPPLSRNRTAPPPQAQAASDEPDSAAPPSAAQSAVPAMPPASGGLDSDGILPSPSFVYADTLIGIVLRSSDTKEVGEQITFIGLTTPNPRIAFSTTGGTQPMQIVGETDGLITIQLLTGHSVDTFIIDKRSGIFSRCWAGTQYAGGAIGRCK